MRLLSDSEMQAARDEFRAWGEDCLARRRVADRQLAEGRTRFARTAADRLQAEWERKRVKRGEAANYQRGRR